MFTGAVGPCKQTIPSRHHVYSPSTGPKQKMPYIRHGKTVVCDSRFIVNYLINTYGQGKVIAGSHVHAVEGERHSFARARPANHPT